jgi:hypothetical protein
MLIPIILHHTLYRRLKLPRPLPKMRTLSHLEIGHALTIKRIISNRIPAPDKLDPVVAERKKDDDCRQGNAGVHCGLREVVVPLPPGECLFPDEIVEEEAKDKPEAVLCCVLWNKD